MSERAKSHLQSSSPAFMRGSNGILQRKCACGNHSFAGAECAECAKKKSALQRKLAIGASNDPLEQEADRIADQITAKPAHSMVSGSSLQIQRYRGQSSEIKNTAPASVDRVLTGSGQPLEPALRQDMEQRFGYDFSGVRVHFDAAAEQSARELDAYAYTAGRHIVFGAGRFDSDSLEGRRLLAHELAHVVQQDASIATGHLIQRAKIPYRQLKWSDFQAQAPQSAPEAAGIFSAFELPNFSVVVETKDTKAKCRDGKNRSTRFKALIEIDPAQADKLDAFMDTDQSWLQDRFKDDGTIFCNGRVKECEKLFDDNSASVRANCEKTVTDCEQEFRKTKGDRKYKINNKNIYVKNEQQCRPYLFNNCQEDLKRNAASFGSGSTQAKARAECKAVIFPGCKSDEKVQKSNLLQHEQGHFDITKVLADKARQSVKAKAATVKISETKCGEATASKAAQEAYDKIYAELKKLVDDWLSIKEKAQKDYDNQTGHGVKMAQQKTWEAEIKAGLKKYDVATLPAGTSNPVAPTQNPVTPVPNKSPSATAPNAESEGKQK